MAVPDSITCSKFNESENDGMSDLCVTLGHQPLYGMHAVASASMVRLEAVTL